MKNRILILMFCVFWMPISFADTITGLYRAEIILPSNLTEGQLLGAAFKQAAKNVLIKVSGRPDLINTTIKDNDLKSAPAWVAQHSILSSDQLVQFNGEMVSSKKVVVTFYEQSINLFLIDRKIAIWGNNRPSVLVWLLEDNGRGRNLSGVNSPSALLSAVATHAADNGLPIYAPILDEVDVNAVSISALWGFFEEEVAQASKRYQTDLFSVVRVSHVSNKQSVDIRVYFPSGEIIPLSFDIANNANVALVINNELSQLLSERYAAVRGADEEFSLKMRLVGIDTYDKMQKVQNYLDSITLVRKWHLASLKDGEVVYIIQSDGGVKKLKDSIALNTVLTENPLSALDPNANISLSYEFKGK
ncbi:DUF2066 domain-containing protein [Marinomonas sp. 15G1-11]|uniref:DUF2066 domain-containing protein n=1 Tax=Marinomonas phaeophyticola TaxID=3004091 RepID=A0ABT4JYF6_9GAMM|nr:DUF2066 domain-containing protein [Marinomonas sp. 15G1-11]MCZ2723417.1 DUF2066 domain-containing protein [Marinomonas sp. 15G1-11]